MSTTVNAGPPGVRAPGPPAQADDSRDTPRNVTAATMDYRLTLVGSLLGSLGLVWVLYTRILPFSGPIGFLICWYIAFLGLFAGVTALAHGRTIVIDRLWMAIITGAACVVGLALVSAVGFVVFRGWTAVHHLNFFTKSESAGDLDGALTQGGILNAIVGSLIELGIATLISLPLGIGTAVFMVEVGGRFARVVRIVVEAMTALPDILAGLFIYAFLIVALGDQRSGLAAALALSVMMLPVVARTAYVQLQVVPGGLREASLALGATQWRTVWRVVLPTQRAGLATAVILGMARAIGETAPVLITSGASTYFNANPFDEPMNSLPLYIYTAVRSGEPKFIERGFAAGIVLLAIVLILFASARFLARSKAGRR
jgi:phosphate transport system permease protein